MKYVGTSNCNGHHHLNKLELTENITLHSNGETLLKQSSSHSNSSPVLQTILLVVLSANGDGSVLTSMASSKINLLSDDTYGWD